MKFTKHWVRLAIISFWLLVITLTLYWPKFLSEDLEPKSITVFTWGDIIEPSLVSEFEKETGIKVYLNYYASNEELMVKMEATGGSGYDLIVPSGYAVEIMSKANLLKKLDFSQMNNIKTLHPLLLGRVFDLHNDYSIPYLWEIYGIGYDKEFFKSSPPDASWNLVFNFAQMNYRIAMLNDPIDAISLAGLYLFGPSSHYNLNQLSDIEKLLIQQKPWVEAYADFRADYFLSTRNCPIAVCSSSYIARTAQTLDFIGFLVPKEGTFITIENFCIPASSNKEALVYSFIDFLFRPSSIKTNMEEYGFFSSCEHSIDLLPGNEFFQKYAKISEEARPKKYVIMQTLPLQVIDDLWVRVKAADDL